MEQCGKSKRLKKFQVHEISTLPQHFHHPFLEVHLCLVQSLLHCQFLKTRELLISKSSGTPQKRQKKKTKKLKCNYIVRTIQHDATHPNHFLHWQALVVLVVPLAFFLLPFPNEKGIQLLMWIFEACNRLVSQAHHIINGLIPFTAIVETFLL